MSYKLDIFNTAGEKVKTIDLPENIFNDDNINEDLIHEFVVMQLANARHPIAHTKTRGEVAYSGRKLYRQKWTGNARVWDAGSPIRRKWGVAFWPRNDRNFFKDMPKKQRRKALFGTLTLKVKDNELIGLEDFKLEQPKTKKAVEILNNLNLYGEKILLVLPEKDENIIKSFRNIEGLKYILVNYVNPYDLLTHKKVVFLESSLNKLSEIFS